MSISYNPKILTNNLVLYLDAGNSQKSYAPSSTVWYDLSNNNNTATMIGSVPFSTDGSGSFDFATITGSYSLDASLGFSFASNMIPTTGSFTLSCWVKNPPSSVGQCGLFANAGGADGYRFGVGLNGVYVLNSGASGVGYSEPTLTFLSTLSASLWYNVTVVFDRANATPQWRSYLNGVHQNTTNMAVGANTAFSNTPPGLVRSACCGLYNGKLSIFSAYSRSLTEDEIRQNFNALRGRFNI